MRGFSLLGCCTLLSHALLRLILSLLGLRLLHLLLLYGITGARLF